MRVIAGKYKGRKLFSPEDSSVRPTTDKVKEACFSILTNDIYDARVLDLFAGSGGLGIEALSRGASYCLFADASRKSLNLVKQNLDHCKVEEETRIAAGDYSKVLKSLAGRIEDGREEPFDIILLDPPYDAGFLDEVFRLIAEGDILAAGKGRFRHRAGERARSGALCGAHDVPRNETLPWHALERRG